jgi:hypothetical protein
MEKKEIQDSFRDCASPVFMNNLANNDKRCGTAASLEEGMKVKLVSFDYFDNVQTIGADEYEKLDSRQKARYSKVEGSDDLYSVDNSYYGVVCEGSVSSISFRTLTSAAQAPALFGDKNIIIPAGRASQVALGIKPYLGKTLKVSHVERWSAGEEWNGRKQRFDGYAAGFEEVEG